MGVSADRNTDIHIAIEIGDLVVLDPDCSCQAGDRPGRLPILLTVFERVPHTSREADGDRIGDSVGFFFSHRSILSCST